MIFFNLNDSGSVSNINLSTGNRDFSHTGKYKYNDVQHVKNCQRAGSRLGSSEAKDT
jgi:hypothetical protein